MVVGNPEVTDLAGGRHHRAGLPAGREETDRRNRSADDAD
jgi:hypothetical protein